MVLRISFGVAMGIGMKLLIHTVLDESLRVGGLVNVHLRKCMFFIISMVFAVDFGVGV